MRKTLSITLIVSMLLSFVPTIAIRQVIGDMEVRVTPKPGYSIPAEAPWTQDGAVVEVGMGGGNQSYTFTMLGDTVIAVDTEVGRFDMVLEMEGPGGDENAVSVNVNGLVADPDDLTGITGGSSLKFTALPAYGYLFDRWRVDGMDAGSEPVLNISALGDDMTVTAAFVDNTAHGIAVWIEGIHGTLEYTLNDGPPVPVASAEVIGVFEGDDVVFTAAPNVNFMGEKWWIDGELEDTRERTMGLEDIGQNHDVTVVFTAQTFSTVTYEAGPNGDITSAATDGVEFESGNPTSATAPRSSSSPSPTRTTWWTGGTSRL